MLFNVKIIIFVQVYTINSKHMQQQENITMFFLQFKI